MIMEIKMNNSLTFDEVADKLGCSVEDLQKIALENGLIDENGNPTEMAIREGLFSQYATMEDEYGTVNITVSHSEYDMIAVCISDPEDHERDSVAFISREKAHALGEYLLNMYNNILLIKSFPPYLTRWAGYLHPLTLRFAT